MTAKMMKCFEPRWRNFKELPGYGLGAIKNTGKTIVGIGTSALSCLTLGWNETINDYADRWTAESYGIFLNLFQGLVTVIHPKAPFPEAEGTESELEMEAYCSNKIALPVIESANEAAENHSSILRKHFFSRGLYALAVPVSIIAGVVDGALAAVAVLAALVSGGTVERVNGFAIKELTFPYSIYNACYSVRGVCNPQQFVDSSKPPEPITETPKDKKRETQGVRSHRRPNPKISKLQKGLEPHLNKVIEEKPSAL